VIDTRISRQPQAYEGPQTWLWVAGVARFGVLFFALASAHFTRMNAAPRYLMAFYVLGFASAIWYLAGLRQKERPSFLTTWVQSLIDFSVVAATVSFTGGPRSYFTFLFVIVVLEVGLLLGLVHGLLFATLAAVYTFAQTLFPPVGLNLPSTIELWYNFVVQGFAYYLTAFITGFWNQRVHRMREFQRDILDNMSSGFLICDARGMVVALNRAGHSILNLPFGEAVGHRVDEIMRVGEGKECPPLTALRAQRDFNSYEFYCATPQGNHCLLGLTTNLLHDQRNNVSGLIASFTDLTEMNRMREELQRQDRMAVIGELATGLAHEIRNPVAIIRGAAEELKGNLENPRMLERLSKMAIAESDHLNDIVANFLNFARNPEVKRERIEVQSLINDTVAGLRHKYSQARDLQFAVQQPETPCYISGDRTQLRQVLINVIENGIEAMEEHGTLTISVFPTDGPVEIRIEDQGPSIPPDQLARIFEPFYTTKESGVGIGLAVCMRIVTAHDGTIQAAARDKGGAAFSIRLPAARSTQVAPREDSE